MFAVPSFFGYNFAKDAFVGLLDTYPNAAAAYSVRKLRAAYTGSAIRVRRSSDNTEQNIGFTALGNLDTTALTSFCSGTNGFVTTWYDQSGNGRDLTQTTAGSQPQIISSGTYYPNGTNNNPAISFNNKYLSSTSFTLSQPTSKIQVFKYTNVSAAIQVVSDNVATRNQLMGYTGTEHWMVDGSTIATYGSRANNTPYVISSLWNGSSSSSLVNSTNYTGLNTGTNATIGVRLGISYDLYTLGAFIGYLSEFVLYPSNNSSNFSGINSNVNTYYGIY